MEERRLGQVVTSLERQFGKGVIFRLGDKPDSANVTWQPSGLLTVDMATGGGWPKGRIIEVYGREHAGKSLLSYLAIAEVQRTGGLACLVDKEYTFTPEWAQLLGVDVNSLYLLRDGLDKAGAPMVLSAEQTMDAVLLMLDSGAFDIVVIDSVPALIPQAEWEKDMEDRTMAELARLMSRFLPKAQALLAQHGTVLIIINQMREKVGVMFGNPETRPGGRALRHWASLNIEVQQGDFVEATVEGEEKAAKVRVGNDVKLRVTKHKCGKPYRTATFRVYYDRGVDRNENVADAACLARVIEKEGAWYKFTDSAGKEWRWHGRERIKADMTGQLADELRLRVMAQE